MELDKAIFINMREGIVLIMISLYNFLIQFCSWVGVYVDASTLFSFFCMLFSILNKMFTGANGHF